MEPMRLGGNTAFPRIFVLLFLAGIFSGCQNKGRGNTQDSQEFKPEEMVVDLQPQPLEQKLIAQFKAYKNAHALFMNHDFSKGNISRTQWEETLHPI